MTRDPFARVPTPVRLWLGCALCILSLGLMWSLSPGYLHLGVFAGCSYIGVENCQIVIVPTSAQPDHALLGSQAPVRVFLVFAALVLAFAATHQRTAVSKRLVRAAAAAIAVTAVLGLRNHAILACQLGALALVAPLVWAKPDPRSLDGVFR